MLKSRKALRLIRKLSEAQQLDSVNPSLKISNQVTMEVLDVFLTSKPRTTITSSATANQIKLTMLMKSAKKWTRTWKLTLMVLVKKIQRSKALRRSGEKKCARVSSKKMKKDSINS